MTTLLRNSRCIQRGVCRGLPAFIAWPLPMFTRANRLGIRSFFSQVRASSFRDPLHGGRGHRQSTHHIQYAFRRFGKRVLNSSKRKELLGSTGSACVEIKFAIGRVNPMVAAGTMIVRAMIFDFAKNRCNLFRVVPLEDRVTPAMGTRYRRPLVPLFFRS